MEPWKSWAIVILFGAGAACYYTQSGKSKRGRGRAAPPPVDQNQQPASSSRNDSKDTRKKKGKAKASDVSDQAVSDAADASSASPQTSPSERARKRKGGKQQPSKLAHSSAVEGSKERDADIDNDEEEDDGLDNADFAKQLSQLKTGTSLKKPVAPNEMKTRKQGKRNELSPEARNGNTLKSNEITSSQDMSTASSTTGADADDDLSLPVSPQFGATQATTPSGLDVSDMLEPPPKGPSVLRLTEPVNQQPAKQPKPQKAAPEPETKKQRQNRRKQEEKKLLREQAEKERRVLLEKQLRTAREAEGRPAKNGMEASQPPSTNAWRSQSSAAAGRDMPPPTVNSEALLDTFEENNHTTRSSANNINGAENNNPSIGGKTWNGHFISEEEQIRLINEIDGDHAWNTVQSGKGKKRSAVAGAGVGVYKAESSGSKTPSSESRAPSFTTFQAPQNNNKDGILTIEDNPATASNTTVTPFMASTSVHNDEAIIPSNEKPCDPHSARKDHGEGFSEYGDYLRDWRKTKWSDGRLKAEDSAADAVKVKTGSSGKQRLIKKRPRRPKATYDTIDHSVWNYHNIKEHPDYDPQWPYALTGHPADSDWDGGYGRDYFHIYSKPKDYYSSEEYSSDQEEPIHEVSTVEKSNHNELAEKESLNQEPTGTDSKK